MLRRFVSSVLILSLFVGSCEMSPLAALVSQAFDSAALGTGKIGFRLSSPADPPPDPPGGTIDPKEPS